jgi:hypothetical protein
MNNGLTAIEAVEVARRSIERSAKPRLGLALALVEGLADSMVRGGSSPLGRIEKALPGGWLLGEASDLWRPYPDEQPTPAAIGR